MINSNGWATVCELKVACDLLKLNIHTFLKGIRFDRDSRTFKTHFTHETYSSSNMSDTTITLIIAVKSTFLLIN
jgi:hypothetical protein